MAANMPNTYAGKILRVDLTTEQISKEPLREADLRKFIGGSGLGIKYLYDEVPPGTQWSDPENRLILATGPLGGTQVGGSGTFSVVTKGPLTDGAASSQANGFLGAFLKFSGFDGIVVHGAANRLVYLYVHDGTAEIRNASHLAGKNTWDTEALIKEELGKRKREMSVFGIGPAGENLVRFACIVGDEGHVAAHNGVGAVMGSKKLKAIAVARGKDNVLVKDRTKLNTLARELLEAVRARPGLNVYEWGTSMVYSGLHAAGGLPVKNYTTSIFPEHSKFMGDKIRNSFEIKWNPCWACHMHHCHIMKVTEGPYKGYVGEEPEYEQWASWGSLIGQTDPGAALMLANENDRLGMDTNEAGWVLSWVLECYEKNILTKEDTDGLEMSWGDAEAVKAMLGKIAWRQGFGDVLAEGVMRAARRVGGQAPYLAIHTMKGNTPRGHDHRAMWSMLFDTCVSDIGTDEGASATEPEIARLSAELGPFSPQYISLANAKGKPVRVFDDCLGTCWFNTMGLTGSLAELLKAATGWDFTREEAIEVGRRIVNLFRSFNIRHGHTAELECPSQRYASMPLDGPAVGKHILPVWAQMLRAYYEQSGWDAETGKPLPQTLQQLGLGHVVQHIW
ncbi:MAG: hypothetical protein HY664_01175 [Chloroflexi bacterium]|nr:hypothetical protein [Chloroflexota bacterium]